MLRFFFAIVSLAIALAASAAGASVCASDSVEVQLFYNLGTAELDTTLSANASALTQLHNVAGRGDISHISIISSASPEGNTSLNHALSRRRAAQALALLHSIDGLDTIPFSIQTIGPDWDRLAAILDSSSMSCASEGASIIRNTPVWIVSDGVVTDSRKLRLQRLCNGELWRCLSAEVFPSLRSSRIVLENAFMPRFATLEASAPHAHIMRDTTLSAPYAIDAVDYTPATHSSAPGYRFGLRSNLLYDCAAVPSLGLQCYISHGWSMALDGLYAPWQNSTRSHSWRIMGAELSVRKALPPPTQITGMQRLTRNA